MSARCFSTWGSTSVTGTSRPRLVGQRGDTGPDDAARDDDLAPRQVGVAVEREAVHRDLTADADADGADLATRAAVVGGDPRAALALDASGLDAEVGADADHHLLDVADVADDVDGRREPDDRVAGDLSRTVPGDLAAAVDVDDGSAVAGSLLGLGALARGVDRAVLEEVDGVGLLTRHDLRVRVALDLPRLLVVDEVGVETEVDEAHAATLRRAAYDAGMPATDASPSTPPRVGLVGYGSAGRGIHAPLIGRAGLTVAAVSTSNATRADEVRADLPGAEVVPDLEALLGVEGLDLVVLASPSGVHAEQAERVIEAGIPLVVDKPLAVDASRALDVVDLAAHHGVPLTVFNNRRFDPEPCGAAHRPRRRASSARSGGPNTVGTVGVPCPSSAGASRSPPRRAAVCCSTCRPTWSTRRCSCTARSSRSMPRSTPARRSRRTTPSSRAGTRPASSATSCRGSVNGAPGPRARVNGSAGSFVIGRQVDDVSAFTEFENDGDAIGWIVRGDERERGPVVTDADQADFYRALAVALASSDPQAKMPVDPRDAVHVLAVVDAARISARDRRVVDVVTPGQTP